MLENFIKRFKLWFSHKPRFIKKSKTASLSPMSHTQDRMEAITHLYEENQSSEIKPSSILDNLIRLKQLIDIPKEEALELRFSQLTEYLGVGENHETVRQERWYPNIHCPSCQSIHIKRITQPVEIEQSHNYRYICQSCGFEFNDDTGTPFEKGVPPLSVWMQCWYLMGFTNSYAYISQKLGLDLTMIEYMVDQLQKTFNSEQPLSHFVDYRDRLKQSNQLQQKLKSEEQQKKSELLSNADIPNVPTDTAEYRKQKERRHNPLSPTKQS